MTELEVVEYLLARANDWPLAVRNWLSKAKLVATVLLFQPAGRDAGGLPLWRVGRPGSAVTFPARSEGVRLLHMLTERRALPLDVFEGGHLGADAVRKRLERGVRELYRYCVPLAEELDSRRSIEGGVARYRRTPLSPQIITEPVRTASEKWPSPTEAPKMAEQAED